MELGSPPVLSPDASNLPAAESAESIINRQRTLRLGEVPSDDEHDQDDDGATSKDGKASGWQTFVLVGNHTKW